MAICIRWLGVVCLLGVLGSLLGCRQAAAAEPRFGGRPRLAYSAAELTAWKADPARRSEVQQIITQADALLQQKLVVPDKESSWLFYYACPKDSTRLRPESAERHVCPKCGAVYTDERTQAAYRYLQNTELERQCRTLSLAYALSGDTRYAQPVREAMLKLARVYPTFERHDRWGRRGLLASIGGWRYVQLLDEAVGVIELAKAYDLIASAPCIDPADCKTIEKDLLLMIAHRIQQYQVFAGEKNNHRTWFNAAYASVAVATGDDTLLNDALEANGGLKWQLQHSVTDDGLWYEGTIAYHFYALSAVMETVDALQRAGIDMRDDARLKSLWLGPMQLTYPNGEFPVMHDSDPGNLRSRQSFYQWAYRYFKDERFAALAAGQAPANALGSNNLAGIGLAVLRRGQGDHAACAMVDYGIHGDSHGHPDKLNLVLYALGRELLLDPGRISYSVPEYQTWARTTVAHNTVVVNGADQREDTGHLLYFNDEPAFTAALTASDGAYQGYALRRFLVMTDTLLVDVFTVQGKEQAQFDWLLHGRGTPTTAPTPAPLAAPLGTKNGYQHLTALTEAAAAPARTVTFTLDDGRCYRAWCPQEGQTRTVLGAGIGYRLDDPVSFLLRRRDTHATAFITVYDLSGNGSAITGVDVLPVLANGKPVPSTDGIGLRITSPRGAMHVAVDLRDDPKQPLTLGGKKIERCRVVGE